MSDSARLEVRDNTFLNVESASIYVVNVDHVEVVGNAFSENAIKVLFEVPQSTQKYFKGLRSTSKIPQSG